MATINKKPTGSFEVQWYENKKRRSKSFRTKKEAREFALAIETAPKNKSSTILFKTLLERYRDTETIKKRGARAETIRINRLINLPLAQQTLADLTVKDFQNWIDTRLEQPAPKGGTISPATVLREYATISSVINYALKNEILERSPIVGLRLPREPEHRERIATPEEQEALCLAAGWDMKSVPTSATQLTALAFIFSCRTGMRAGEILAIEPAWIEGHVIHLPKEITKTASKRDVALNSDALRLLNLAIESKRDRSPRVFSALGEHNREVIFRRIRERAGLGEVTDSAGNVIKEALHFHDGRATFATWAASPDPETGAPRLDVLALARQTGHKDLKMLQRYYRATASDIAKRLD